SPYVELRRLPESPMDLRDVDRDALRRPDVVVVDARGHHELERLTSTGRRRLDLLDPERVPWLPEPLGADELRVHPRGDLAHGRDVPDLVDVLRHRGLLAVWTAGLGFPGRRTANRRSGLGYPSVGWMPRPYERAAGPSKSGRP